MNHDTFLCLNRNLDRRLLRLNPYAIGENDLHRDIAWRIPTPYGRHMIRLIHERIIADAR